MILTHLQLLNIFENFPNRDFKIRIIGKGKALPTFLTKYENKIDFLNNKNFIEYHKAFNGISYILPLVDETFKHEYFLTKYTSSISYGIGYKIPFLAHRKLQKIYNIEGFFYKNTQEFTKIFGKTLDL